MLKTFPTNQIYCEQFIKTLSHLHALLRSLSSPFSVSFLYFFISVYFGHQPNKLYISQNTLCCRSSMSSRSIWFSTIFLELDCHWTVEIEKFQFRDQRKPNISLVNERKLHGPNKCKRNTRTHVNQNMLHSINTTIKWVFISSLIALSPSLCVENSLCIV